MSEISSNPIKSFDQIKMHFIVPTKINNKYLPKFFVKKFNF